MAKSEKSRGFELRHPRGKFPRHLHFNRFRIERGDGFTFVQFGLVLNSREVVGDFSCVISDMARAHAKGSLLPYLGQIGTPKSKFQPWSGVAVLPGTSLQAEIADTIGMSHTGDLGEITFGAISHTALINAKTNEVEFETDPIILLRCDGEMLRHFIQELYADSGN